MNGSHKPNQCISNSTLDSIAHSSIRARQDFLICNIYGTTQAARLYHTGLSNHLTSHGYKPTDADQCLFYKTSHHDLIFIAIKMDEVLSVASITELQDELYATLTAKYKIKRLGFPTKYLKWHMKRLKDGTIHISQLTVAGTILKKLECSPPTQTHSAPSQGRFQLDTR